MYIIMNQYNNKALPPVGLPPSYEEAMNQELPPPPAYNEASQPLMPVGDFKVPIRNNEIPSDANIPLQPVVANLQKKNIEIKKEVIVTKNFEELSKKFDDLTKKIRNVGIEVDNIIKNEEKNSLDIIIDDLVIRQSIIDQLQKEVEKLSSQEGIPKRLFWGYLKSRSRDISNIIDNKIREINK
jgi:hypothetical protein